MTQFAKIVSIVFHPLLMPTLGFFIILDSSIYLSSSIDPLTTKITYATIFIFTCVLPFINVWFLVNKGYAKDIYLRTRKERKLPYLFSVVYYLILYYFLKTINLPPAIYLMVLGTTIAAIITLLINLRWKISAHMVGIGGVLGAVIGISERFMQNLNGTIIVLFLVAGMIGYARLKLDAHTSSQVYAGFATGFGCLLLMIIAF